MSSDDDPAPPGEGESKKPLLISLIEKGIYRYGFSLRYVRPRGFSNAEVWSPDRIDVEPGFSVNPYTTFEDEIDRYLVKDPSSLAKLASKFAKSYLKVGGYDKFPFNTVIGWKIALNYWRKNVPWPSPSNNVKNGLKPRVERLDPDVLVIGAGISGLHAALSASRSGLNTIVLEMEYWPGGKYDLLHPEGGINRLATQLIKSGVKILTTTVFQGFHSDTPYAIDWKNHVLYLLNPKTYIFATGHYEVPPLVENIDYPKAIPLYSFLKLLKHFSVKAFRRIIFFGCDDRVQTVVKYVEENGLHPVFIGCDVDGYESYPNPDFMRLRGRNQFEYVEFTFDGKSEKIYGDLFVYLGDRVSNSWLTMQAGLTHVFINGLGGYIP